MESREEFNQRQLNDRYPPPEMRKEEGKENLFRALAVKLGEAL